MDKSVSQERKTVNRSKAGVGLRATQLYRAGLNIYDRSCKAGLRKTTYFTALFEVSKTAKIRVCRAFNGLTKHKGKGQAGNGQHPGKIRPLNSWQQRTQILHLVL